MNRYEKDRKIGSKADRDISINIFNPRNRDYTKKYITSVILIRFLGNNEYQASIITGYPLGDGGTYGKAFDADVIFNMKKKKIITINNGSIRATNKKEIIQSMENFVRCRWIEWE